MFLFFNFANFGGLFLFDNFYRSSMLCHRIVMDFMSEVVFHQRHCQRSMATCLLRCSSSCDAHNTANNYDDNSNKLQQSEDIYLLKC